MLEPHRLEPKRVRDSADDDSSEDNKRNKRSNSTVWSLWCSCRRCEVMLTPKECICCVGIRNRRTRWSGVPILFLELRNRNRI